MPPRDRRITRQYTAAENCTEYYNSQKRGNIFEALADKLSFQALVDKEADPSVFFQGKIKAQASDKSDGVRANESGRGDRFWLVALPGRPNKPIKPIYIHADEEIEKKRGRQSKMVDVISVNKMKEVGSACFSRKHAIRALTLLTA